MVKVACTVCVDLNNIEDCFEFCGGCPKVDVIFSFFSYNLVGPDCWAVLRPGAVRGGEPEDQLAEGTPLYLLLLEMESFVMGGVWLTCI